MTVQNDNGIIENKVEMETKQLDEMKVSTAVPTEKIENVHQEEKAEDPNWKAFREARKLDRIKREEAERKAAEKEAEATALKAAMEAAFAKNTPPNTPAYSQTHQYQDPYREETEDERIEKKVQAQFAAREAQYQRERQQREHQEYPQKLQQAYPDFNRVIEQENLDYLDYHYPEISRPLGRLPDNFDKWSDIYHAIKKFVPNLGNAKKDAMRAEINQAKPRSSSIQGITQPTQTSAAHVLSEEKKAANWARMQQQLKGLSQ